MDVVWLVWFEKSRTKTVRLRTVTCRQRVRTFISKKNFPANLAGQQLRHAFWDKARISDFIIDNLKIQKHFFLIISQKIVWKVSCAVCPFNVVFVPTLNVVFVVEGHNIAVGLFGCDNILYPNKSSVCNIFVGIWGFC